MARNFELALKGRYLAALTCLCRNHSARLQEGLGLQVICGGEETTGERDVLIEMGVPLLQGYLFGRRARDISPREQLELHSVERLIVPASPVEQRLAKSS
jgi:EAL domain-containing protein (putative c-di-GMP-specific phosphodiesterase class I)